MDGAADARNLADRIAGAIRSVVGTASQVPLHAPEFGGNEWAYVKDCLDTGWVSSVGSYVDRFEADAARLTGTLHGIAVANGTVALEVAMIVAGVEPGDEVLMPALTFVATANAARHAGGVPHFIDVDRRTLGLDATVLDLRIAAVAERRGSSLVNRETGRRIAAIVPVHCLGHPTDMDALLGVASSWGLPVIEDAAEALGSLWNGKPCGGLGTLGALSFNGNKILTTGGGGVIVTNDPGLARRAKHLTTTAKVAHRWAFRHDEAGFNYRMPNLNAALGVAQLEQLSGRIDAKRTLARRYGVAFSQLPGVALFPEPEGATSNCWLNTIMLDPGNAFLRDPLLDALDASGLQCRPVWDPMHSLPMYDTCPRGDLTVTEDIAARAISIPSSAHLGRSA